MVRGMFKLLGIPEQISAVTKNGESDFWTTLDGGGLACFDNVDTRIDWLPDALAAAATAGSHQKRKLYTDGLWGYPRYEMFEWTLHGNPNLSMGEVWFSSLFLDGFESGDSSAWSGIQGD